MDGVRAAPCHLADGLLEGELLFLVPLEQDIRIRLDAELPLCTHMAGCLNTRSRGRDGGVGRNLPLLFLRSTKSHKSTNKDLQEKRKNLQDFGFFDFGFGPRDPRETIRLEKC